MDSEIENIFSIEGFIRYGMAEDESWDDFRIVVIRLCIFYFIYHLARRQILSAMCQAMQNPEEGLPQLQDSVSQYMKDVLKTIHAGALLLLIALVLGIPGTVIVCYILIIFFFVQEGHATITKTLNLVTHILSKLIRQHKDSLDLVALAMRMVRLSYRICCITWQILYSLKGPCTQVINSPHWNTLKNTLDSVTRPVSRYLRKRTQSLSTLIDLTSESIFRMRGGREALRKALKSNAELSEANTRLTEEIAALRLQAKPRDIQGIWIRERPSSSGQPHSFQLEVVRKLRQDSRDAHKESQRWRKAWEERQARIDELEACDADAEARVLAATAHRDERIRALETEKTAVAASAASKVNALASALEAEKAESHRLRSSLEAQVAKSGDLESRLESERVVSQRLGEDVAVLRRQGDAKSALLDKVKMEAAEAERAAADLVRGQKDAEISVLTEELAKAKADAAVVVVDTAEIGVQTDLAAEASPVITPVDVSDAGTQTECIDLDVQSQLAASANLESELLESKKALEERGRELAGYQHAWKKTSDDLVRCNADLQKVLKEASELRSWNTKGGQELQQSKRDAEQLKQMLAIREEEATNLLNQLQQYKERDQQQQPVAEEVKYWRARTEGFSTEMARLRAENLEVKGKFEEVQQRFKIGEGQYHALQRDLRQRLETKENSYKELEKQLKAEIALRARDVQPLMQTSQIESLQKQVMSKDDEIRDLRRQIDQHNLASEVAVSTPRSDRIGASPFPTPTKTPITKLLESKAREHAEDKKKHAIEKQQLEGRIALQAQDLQKLWDTKDQLEQEKQRLEAENQKLREQISDEAMDVAFAKEFFEEDKEEIKQAHEEAENWKTQFDEAQVSVKNMQLDLQFKEGQVDAARMQADLYKTQAQNLQVQQAPQPQLDHLPSLRLRPNKRIASADIQGEQPVQDTKKIMTKSHYQGQLPQARLRQAQVAQPPQAQATQPPQAQITQPPQAQANQTATREDEQTEENMDESSIISEEE